MSKAREVAKKIKRDTAFQHSRVEPLNATRRLAGNLPGGIGLKKLKFTQSGGRLPNVKSK